MRNYLNALLLIICCAGLQNCEKPSLDENTSQFNNSLRFNNTNVANQVIIRYASDYDDETKAILRSKYAQELNFQIDYIETAAWDNKIELWKMSKVDGDGDIDVNDLVTNMKTKEFDEGDLEESSNIISQLSSFDDFFIPSTNSTMAQQISDGDGPIIAIIDSGLDYGELDSNVLYETGTSDSEEISGWDFINDDNDIRDDFGHGTHITHIINEELKNHNIIPRFVSLKAFDDSGQTNLFKLLEALSFVNAHDEINILNMSLGWLGSGEPNAILEEVLDEISENTLVVSSAGNNGQDTDPYKNTHFPSGIPNDLILCVGGFVAPLGEPYTSGDNVEGIERSEWSNYGKKKVDIFAPFDKYKVQYSYMSKPKYLEGTSYSAAFASARSALLYNPNASIFLWRKNIIQSGFNSLSLKYDCQSKRAILINEIQE